MNESALVIVVAFAVGMAWVESACVYYLRVLVDRVEPYQANPLPISGTWAGRAGAGGGDTGHAADARRPRRAHVAHAAGYTAIAFGMWDIFYYVFLRVMSGWPRSLLDWDVLFLLPLPWWGPVLAPVSIAVMMIVGGTLVTQRATAPLLRRRRCYGA